MNEKITLKNNSFMKMFSFLVVLVMVVFCSTTALAQIQVRLNLTPDRVYNGSQYGGLEWKNSTAKLVNATTGAEIPVALCDVTSFDPQTMSACRFSDKNAGKNKTCEVTDLSQFSSATLTDPVTYQLVPITSYTPVTWSKLSYDPVGARLVSTKGEIKHAFLTATYNAGNTITKTYNGSDLLDGNQIELGSINLSGYVAGETGCYVSEITNVYAPSANVGLYNTTGNKAIVNGIRIDATVSSIAFNYKIHEFEVNARILPKIITVKEDAIKILDHQYDGTNTATIDWATTTTDPNLLFSGVIAGDAIDLDRTIGTATFSDASVANLKNVNISGLLLNGPQATNYNLIPNTALSHGNITKANLDPTLTVSATPVVYGTKLVDIVGTTITPAPVGFDYRIEWLYNNVDSNSYQPLVSETGSPLIKARLIRLVSTSPSADDANYNSIIVPANITVTPKDIMIDLIGANNKEYDGTTTAVVNTANVTYNTLADLLDVKVTRNGVLDDLSIDFSPLTATFSDANAGNSKTVNFSGTPLETGTSLPNYNISYNSATLANITKAPMLTMKLKDAVTFSDIDFPTNFSDGTSFNDFDFVGFIGTDATTFGANFAAENFKYELKQGGVAVLPTSPQPGTYDVFVNKGGVTLANEDLLTMLDINNQLVINNYEGLKFLSSDRTQNVNPTLVTIEFPAQDKTVYGWTLKEIFNATAVGGVQVIDAAANADLTKIHATTTSGPINGTFKWVYPDSIPNVALAPGEYADYIFLPDAIYGGAYGDTIRGLHPILLNKANLDPTLSLSALPVVYGTRLVDIVNTTITPAPVGFNYRIEWLYNNIDSNSYQPLVAESGSPLIQARLIKLESTFPSNDDPNYNTLIVPANITINPKPIYVSSIDVNNKVFDGSTTAVANVSSVTYNTKLNLSEEIVTRNGVVDDLAIDFSTLSLSFPDANVGTNKAINIATTPTATGTSLPNYNVSYDLIIFADITKAPMLTMKLKDAVLFPAMNYPMSFTYVPSFGDFDFTGFIGTDAATFATNFASESFTYQLKKAGLDVPSITPHPDTYDVFVNKAGVTLANNDILTLLNLTNQAIVSNYEGITFLSSDRTQIVNATPVTIIFPPQDITEYGWTLKEIYNSTAINGEQVIDLAANTDPTKIHAITTSGPINGTFKWVYPDSIPNVSAIPGEYADYIFIPDASYAGAYGDTVSNPHYILLNRADLAITIAPSTSPIYVGQTVGDATITSPSGAVIHKNKLNVVYNTTTNPTIGNWSYLNPTEVMTVAGPYSKDIQFTLTDAAFTRNYNSPVTLTNTSVQAQASVSVSPVSNNVNPDGVRFEFVYGTTIGAAAAAPIIDPITFILPGKAGAAPGTFSFVTDGTGTTPINPTDIPYRSIAADTTLWVVYTPADGSYAPDVFLARVQINPKVLTYDLTYTKVYDGKANFRVNTSNADLIPAGQLINRGLGDDDVTFDSIIFDLDTKNAGNYDQTNILPATVLGQLTGSDAHNYVLAPMPTLAAISITPAALIVNVSSDTISIREELPTFNVNWTGFVNNEDFSTAITDNGQPLFVAYGLNHLTTGDYATSIGSKWIQIPAGKYTAINNNYTITNQDYLLPILGTELTDVLTVLPAQIKIIAQDRQRVYGEVTNQPYFIDEVNEEPNPLYYDFDVYEYRSSTDSVLISESEKETMFLQNPTMSCDSNQYRLQVGTYVISLATNTQLKNNNVYEIIDHVNGILTVNKATPRINALPTTLATAFGTKLSNITFVGGAAVHPDFASALSTAGHFEWDVVDPNIVPVAGQATYKVKYVVDDSHNYNNAIINNQYNDSINGYYNWTPVANDPLSGANFEVSVTINQVQPVIIWPTASILHYGQTLATATLTNGSTYNPVDVNPTFTWTIADPTTEYPVAGMTMYEVLYTPSNPNYIGLASEIPVYTNKTTPTLTGAPIVASYSYGQTLSANTITASFKNTYNDAIVAGTIDWVNGTLTPVDGMTYVARFTPTDAANYNTKLINIQVQVTPVTPTITSWPTASSLVYGQKIEDASISGGLAVNPNNVSTSINGTFVWVAPTTLAITGANGYAMQFIPSDASKYLPVTGNVNIYTQKATPVVEVAPIASAVYGYTLSQRPLTIITAENNVSHINGTEVLSVAGTINWNTPAATPTVNQDTYLATFTPTQTANYNSVVIPISVITTQATPVMNPYTVNPYSNGQKLNANSINLSAIPAYNAVNNASVGGAISWNSPETTPINGDSYIATFRPNDVINYTSTVVSIPVVVNAASPVVSWPAVSHLTYGQEINDVILTGGSAVNPNDNRMAVAGNFVWQTPNAVPVVGTASYTLSFIPTDITMLTVSTSIQITTIKATPQVTLNPVATDTYGKTLANRPLSYNTANNVISHRASVETLPVAGTIAWNNNAIIPTVANNEYKATFTPTDIANYNTVLIDVNVPTTKATPIVAATVAQYSYGQALPINTPTLTSAVNPVNNTLVLAGGQIVWNSIDELPLTGNYDATYYPLDNDNYDPAQVSISVTVNASAPVVTWPSVSNLVYGQTLADADLTNGSAKNVNNEGIVVAGQFVWVTPTTTPVAGITPNVLQFIPSNSNLYTTITNNNVNVYTAKATPQVTLNAVATDTYGKTLANRPLSYNTANNVISHRASVETLPVAGTIAWNNLTTIPTVANNQYTATFTPTDIANFNTVVLNVIVPTDKATPVINGAAVAAYSYGQALPANTISVTSVVNPNDPALVLTGGTINWNSIDVLPATGTRTYKATYIPSVSNVANYNPVEFNVDVTVNKAAPQVTWPSTSEITYGQTLSQVYLIGSPYAVNTNNNLDVPGTFVWESPTTVTPANPATSYKLRFIPTDLVNYYTDSTMINLVINKANPIVNWGDFSTITYGEALSDISITNQSAVNPITGLTVSGSYAWTDSSIEPNVNNSGFVRTFVPVDGNNYLTVVSQQLPVVVNKATPVLTQTFSPYVITYGQVLPAVTATAVNPNNNASVNGNYEWDYPETHQPQSGTALYQVHFIPTGIDAENYNIARKAFNVQVNKAKPVLVAPTASSLIYEQTLAESLLTGGSAMNANNNDAVAGTFQWTTPTTIPDAGNNAYPVVFIPQDKTNYDNSDPINVVVEVAKKHIEIEIYDLVHIYDGNQKEASFRDAEGNVDLTGMVDAKYFTGNTNVAISTVAPINEGSYKVVATIVPTSNYEGTATAMLVINKNVASMTDPAEQVEVVNAIVPGMNQYFKIRDYEQMMPIKVRMVNSNGNQVYQSDNYKNNFDMSNLPIGTYFYAITFTINGTEYNKTGRVEVVGK